jgi:O-antigen ligase
MLLILGGVVGLAVAAALVALFVRWERGGNPQLAPLVLLGLLIVESTLYAGPDGIPRGLFHPGSGSTQLRLPEIYITLALIARLIARGKPKRIGLPAALWLVFIVCLFVGMAEGVLYHNQFSQNIYEAKAVIYVGGAYALAAGVPVRRYYDRGDLFRLGTLCVVCATLLDLMTFAGVSVNTTLPLLPLQGFGQVGNESAAILLAVFTISFLTRLASGPIRLRHVLALIPVVVCVVLAQQRAVLVNLGVVILVVAAAVIARWWRGLDRRFHVRSGQVVVALLTVVAVVIAIVVVPAAVDRRPPQIPLASSYEKLFHNEAKAESAQDRLNLASEVEMLIPQHLFIGWGLGVRFPFFEAGVRKIELNPYAHDFVLDLWLRLGLLGLLSFLAALGASVAEGLRVWRRQTDPAVAGLALALVAVVAGLTATGLLEPLLDEYRFVTLFGVSLGMLRACATSLDSRRRLLTWHVEAVGSGPVAGGTRWVS